MSSLFLSVSLKEFKEGILNYCCNGFKWLSYKVPITVCEISVHLKVLLKNKWNSQILNDLKEKSPLRFNVGGCGDGPHPFSQDTV